MLDNQMVGQGSYAFPGPATASAPRRTVQDAVSEIPALIVEIHQTIQSLETRIHSVLDPSRPTDSATSAKALDAPGLLSQVEGCLRGLGHVRARLDDLTTRIHL